MEIKTVIDGANATITLVGSLTVATSLKLEAAFADLPESVTDLVLDLAELEYVASAGLRVILSQAKRNNGTMRITNPNDDVMEVFDVTGLVDILDIEK